MTHRTKNPPMVVVPVRLPQDLRKALRKRATEEERPASVLIRRALRQYLEAPAS